MRVFFDTSILKLGVRKHYVLVPQEVLWGSQLIKAQIQKLVNKPRRSDWIQTEIDCLIAIAHAIRIGTVRPCICSESMLDGMSVPEITLYKSELSIFHESTFDTVKDPEIFGMMRVAFGSEYDPQEVRNKFLSTKIYKRFNELKEALGGNKDSDAFLIWTAETAGVPYFLTSDKKLVNSVRNQNLCAIGTHVLLPSELMSLIDTN